MKVYVKKEDKDTMFPAVIVVIVFLLFSASILIPKIRSSKSFADLFGNDVFYAIVFLGFGMYLAYLLIKPPIVYKVKLINKKIEMYNGKKITCMKFTIEKENKQGEDFIFVDYECYTIGENNLIIGKEYLLSVKEANFEPKYVKEIEKTSKNQKIKLISKPLNITMTPVFLFIGLIFSGELFFCILGIILYPKYTLIYITFGTFFSMVLFAIFKSSQEFKMSNNIELNKQNSDVILKEIKPISNNQMKVGNIMFRDLLAFLIIFTIVCFIFLKLKIKEIFNPQLLMLLFLEFPIIIMILYSIGYDKRLIKRHKVNITENINIVNIKQFNIFRANKNTTFPQYFIVDQYKNLIFKLKKSSSIGNKFIICNHHDIKVGEIKLKKFILSNEFVINMINEKPFVICFKMMLSPNYQIIGRDYYVKEDERLVKNVIFNSEGNVIACIFNASQHNNNWYELGNAEIVLNENVHNSVDIMMMALCITIANFQVYDRYTKR